MSLVMIGWGLQLGPPRHRIAEWEGRWIEPGAPPGIFRHWRLEDGHIVGETEPFPPEHPRSFARLQSQHVAGNDTAATVHARLRFLRGSSFGYRVTLDDAATEVTASVHFAPEQSTGIASVTATTPAATTSLAEGTFAWQPEQATSFEFRLAAKRVALRVNGIEVVAAPLPSPPTGAVEVVLHDAACVVERLEFRTP